MDNVLLQTALTEVDNFSEINHGYLCDSESQRKYISDELRKQL